MKNVKNFESNGFFNCWLLALENVDSMLWRKESISAFLTHLSLVVRIFLRLSWFVRFTFLPVSSGSWSLLTVRFDGFDAHEHCFYRRWLFRSDSFQIDWILCLNGIFFRGGGDLLLDTSMRAIFSKQVVPKLFLHPHPYFLSQQALTYLTSVYYANHLLAV